eukprot:GHUV01027476.1.p1 GENE.GHUV01027476.1~~GHUV01027476.1.p1  ORF type:complete len:130 (+),score=36.82 GHUV01027476.1:193-582(+)
MVTQCLLMHFHAYMHAQPICLQVLSVFNLLLFSIRGHPTSEVSRKAKQLVFGFQAMSFLKTEGLSYAVKKEDYLKYFRRAADRNRLYVPSEEEKAADQAEATKAAAVALGVVLGPVVLIGALVAGSKIG